MTQIQRVAGARVVDVVALLVRHQPIVREVVDALEAQRRTALVALRRVVVDHVENDFEAGIVQTHDHLLEFLHAAHRIGEVARIGGEETNRVVAPVVRQPALQQMAVVDEHVNRQQLDRRDAERLDVLDHFRRRQSRERAAQRFGHGRMQLRVTAHVGFVDDRAIPRHERLRVLFPVEARVDDDALGHERRAVALVESQIVAFRADRVAETGVIPLELPDVFARVRIEQQLVGIEAMALFGLVRTMHAIAVHLSRPDAARCSRARSRRCIRAARCAAAPSRRDIEQTQFDLGGVRRKQGEIDAFAVPGRAAGMGQTFADADGLVGHGDARALAVTSASSVSRRTCVPRASS